MVIMTMEVKKMKVTKKILAVLLCVVMAFSAMASAFTVSAKEEVTPVVFVPGIGHRLTSMTMQVTLLQTGTFFTSTQISQASQSATGSAL